MDRYSLTLSRTGLISRCQTRLCVTKIRENTTVWMGHCRSSGGVGVGAWVGIGDAALRTMLSQQDGVNIVNGAVKSVPYFSSLKNGHHGLCEVIMTVEHHAGGLGGASYPPPARRHPVMRL